MGGKSIFTCTLLLTILTVSFSQPIISVKAGLIPEEVEVEPGGIFILKLVILEGGSLVKAGEFNLSYTTDSLELLSITSVNEWEVMKARNMYAFYTIKAQPEKTEVAELKFRYKLDTPANVTLLYLKAAGTGGKELEVILTSSTVQVRAARGSTGRETPSVIIKRERELPFSWIAVIVISAVAAVAAALALSQMKKTSAAYILVDGSGRVVFRTTSNDRVYGREDFTGVLTPDKLVYITRRAKGGQFRIIKGRDGWYIIDAYSTNPTMVNGIPIKGRGYVRLNDGDHISVQGVFDLYFRVSGSG
ncbi:MAG: FHA domain-containing protein [Desulfurococcaceae archaeon]